MGACLLFSFCLFNTKPTRYFMAMNVFSWDFFLNDLFYECFR